MVYEAVIGLEVHAQLLTKTKIFCSCPNQFGSEQNSQVCPVCSGMPGVLPVLNREAVELAIRMGLATGCTIRSGSTFARKNYFYPDLPKAYQITQYDKPICEDGFIDIDVDGVSKRIRIKRIHLEEYAGKSIHDRSTTDTYVDFNRCGTPLIEIVTEPDLSSGAEAHAYLAKIRQLVRWLSVCDGNMEEGSLRCDANVSIRPKGEEKLGTKAELKNMNWFKQVEKAIRFEIDRQTDLVETGGKVIQQTLLWDPDAEESRPMRSKEDAHDYRYFPDPDLMPIDFKEQFVDDIRAALPELPEVRRTRFTSQLGLPTYDAAVLTEEKSIADFFESVLQHHNNAKAASNWMMTEVLRIINDKKIELRALPFDAKALADLIKLIDAGTISGKIAKKVFEILAEKGGSPEVIIKEQGLVQVSDASAIQPILEKIITDNPTQTAEYRSGKTKVFGYFVGEAMKATRGQANPKTVNELLQKLLAQN